MPKQSKSDAAISIEISVLDSVSKDNLQGILESTAELTLDNILESEELKQIPVFGTLVRGVKLGASLRDRLFARKLLAFLREVASIPEEKRIEFVDKLSSRGNKQRAGEAILLLLERLDDMTKPEIVGKIVCSAILGEIDNETCLKLSSMVDRAYITDLLSLPDSEVGRGIDPDVAEALASVGLLERRMVLDVLGLRGRKGANLPAYSLNKYGKALVGILNKDRETLGTVLK